PDLFKLGLVDGVVPEPPGGAQTDWDAAAVSLGTTLRGVLAELGAMTPRQWVDDRYTKFRKMGSFYAETSSGVSV
ncbi:MAG: acetyl-CoA carboxylase carboxyl transferase subunit alpha, partial [Bryobacteraceae bacterium]